MTLTEFLLARIAEDEVSAGDHYACHEDGADVVGAPCAEGDGSHPCKARTRLLAECEAKSRIVEFGQAECSDYGRSENAAVAADLGIEEWKHYPDPAWGHCDGCAAAEAADGQHLATLRHLAAIYADHPDYRQEWKP